MFTERGTMVMAEIEKIEAKKETYDFIKEHIVHKQIKVPVLDIKEMTVWMRGYKDCMDSILDLLEKLEVYEVEQ